MININKKIYNEGDIKGNKVFYKGKFTEFPLNIEVKLINGNKLKIYGRISDIKKYLLPNKNIVKYRII